MTIPDTLQEKLELWRRRGRVVKYREGVFLDASWIAVYLGQGIVPDGWDPRAGAAPHEGIAAAIERLRHDIAADVARRPDHRAFLQDYCPMADAA